MKIVHHNGGLPDNTDEERKSYLEIPALELGHLTDNQRNVAREFLQKHSGMFASGESSGTTNIMRHRINTGDAQPIRQGPRRLPLAKQEKVEKRVRKMLDDGVIEESNSPWSSPVVVITKKKWVDEILPRLQEIKRCNQEGRLPASRN